jgi:hypothetical protein
MRRATSFPLFSLLALSLMGCPESLPGSLDDDGPGQDAYVGSEGDSGAEIGPEADAIMLGDSTQPDTMVQPAAPLAECEPEVIWFHQPNIYNFIYGDADLVLSPNGQLVALQSGMSREYFRVRDGEPLGRDPVSSGGVAAGQWDHGILQGQEAVTVVHLPSGNKGPVLAPPPAGNPELDWLSALFGVVSSDSKWVAAISCWQVVGPGPSETSVTVWDRASGALVRSVVLKEEEECNNGYWLEMPRLFFAAGDLLLVQPLGSGRLYTIELEGVEVNSFDPAAGLEPALPASGDPPVYVPYLAPIVDADLASDGERLAAILHDGKLRFYDLPTMQQFGPEIPAGFAGINLMTYGPSTASPVVWSADGSVLAHMSPTGEVAISRADSGETVHVLPNPTAESAGAIENFINPPVAFRFIHNDSGLLVVHEMGAQLWHCGEPAWPDVSTVPLSLKGPEQVTSGDLTEFVFEYPELPGPVIHSLVNDAGESYQASLAPFQSVHLYGPDVATVFGRIETGTVFGESDAMKISVEAADW